MVTTSYSPTAVSDGASDLAKRYMWVDAAKGIGITLVVIGHVLRGLVSSNLLAWSDAARFADHWIYSFHMPLFFFLSGLFLIRSTKKPWKDFAIEKVRTLAYPYFVWSIIALSIASLLGSAVNHPFSFTDLTLILYSPIDQFWFLYVLLILSLSISALLRLPIKPWSLLLIAILIYPGILPISFDWGVLAETSIYGIYAALGLAVGATVDPGKFLANVDPAKLGMIAFGGLLVSLAAGWPDLPYRAALAPLFAIDGILAVVATSVFATKIRLAQPIVFLGRHSLEIYVAHTIASAAVRITLLRLAHISDPALHLLLGTLAGLFFPVALAVFFQRVGFRYGFSLPDSSIAPAMINPAPGPKAI